MLRVYVDKKVIATNKEAGVCNPPLVINDETGDWERHAYRVDFVQDGKVTCSLVYNKRIAWVQPASDTEVIEIVDIEAVLA